MAKTEVEWGDGAPTISIDVRFNAEQMMQLLAGDGVRLEEITAKTLYEVAGAIVDPKQAEIDDLEWEQARLRYYIEALERRLPMQERDAAAVEAYTAWSQHDPPARARERAR